LLHHEQLVLLLQVEQVRKESQLQLVDAVVNVGQVVVAATQDGVAAPGYLGLHHEHPERSLQLLQVVKDGQISPGS